MCYFSSSEPGYFFTTAYAYVSVTGHAAHRLPGMRDAAELCLNAAGQLAQQPGDAPGDDTYACADIIYATAFDAKAKIWCENHCRFANSCCKYHIRFLYLQNTHTQNLSLMEENQGSRNPNIFQGMQINLPNATAVLVLGIASIVSCFCYAVPGVICGIIALVLSGKSMSMYNADPARYTSSSLSNVKAGKICAIIGLILSALYLICIVIAVATIGIAGMRHPELWMKR